MNIPRTYICPVGFILVLPVYDAHIITLTILLSRLAQPG